MDTNGDEESGRLTNLRCRVDRNPGAQGDRKFHHVIFANFSYCNRYLVSFRRGIGRKND